MLSFQETLNGGSQLTARWAPVLILALTSSLARHSVGRKLRGRRQDLLRLSGYGRGSHQAAFRDERISSR
jgi:hypothetical protein